MKRSLSIPALAWLAAASFAVPAFAADPEALRQKLEAIKAAREKARADARAAAAQNPTPPPTATPTTPPPPPPPTATATPTATVAPTASVAPKASASASATPPAASASAVPSASASAAPVAPVLLDLEALKKTRVERKHREAGGLRERWGDLASSEQAKSELKQHAQRSAYLQRIRALAESRNDAKTVESVDKLITEEERRNANAMNALRTGGKP